MKIATFEGYSKSRNKMEIEIKYDKTEKIIPFMNGAKINMEASPFVIFLASIGMCSAVFVSAFMKERSLSLEGVRIIQKMSHDYASKHVTDIELFIDLPSHFPMKYHSAIKKVVNQCTVKQHLMNPPKFEVITNFD